MMKNIAILLGVASGILFMIVFIIVGVVGELARGIVWIKWAFS